MSGELHELSVAIGRLQEGLENLTTAFREFSDSTTDEHRKVHDIVVAQSESVRNLAAKVKDIEVLTDDYRTRRDKGLGMAAAAKWVYVTGGGLAAAIFVKIIDALPFRAPPH